MTIRTISLAALLTMVLGACAGSTVAPSTPATAPAQTTTPQEVGQYGLPLVDPLDVAGDVVSAGSSTVFPLTEAVAARFEDEGYIGQITIDSIGTGAGFERFCTTGETDIANASRPIKEEEVAACQAIGREPIGFRVGTDALAVAVSPSNYFAKNLTLEQLALAYSTASTWADVDPGFPAHPILRFSPGTDSGTFDYFVETVFDKDEAPLLGASSLQLSEDDNVLVQGVSGDSCIEGDTDTPCAIGYFGYAYYTENTGELQLLSIEGIGATAENVDNGTYPLARPLFIYSDSGIMAEKPQVASFIAYYLSVVNELITEVGYFPAPAADLEASAQAWLKSVG